MITANTISDWTITWADQSGTGWMMKDGRFWQFHCSPFCNSVERDGQITWRGTHWASANDKIISCSKAVIDDFGYLVPVV